MRATAWPPLKADWLSEQDLHAQSVQFHAVRLCPGRVGVRCEFCEWSIWDPFLLCAGGGHNQSNKV